MSNLTYKTNIIASPIILPGCVGYWDLNPENGKIPDLSGYGADGTLIPNLINGESYYIKNILGNAWVATDYRAAISFGNQAQYQFSKTTPFSINIFVKANTATLPIQKYSASSTPGWYTIFAVGYYSLIFNGGTGLGNMYVRSSAYWLNSVNYHMMTCTYNGINNAGMKVYIDGIDYSATRYDILTGDIIGTSQVYMANSSYSNRTERYHPSIYNRELSSGEVYSLYKSYQQSAVVFKTCYEGVDVTGNISTVGAPIGNTPFKVATGTWKISSDTINGVACKVLECVAAGTAYIDGSLLNQGLASPEGKWQYSLLTSGVGATNVWLITSTTAVPNTSLGVSLSGGTASLLRKASAATITATGVANSVYNKFEIDRTTNNYLRMWVNGTNYGGTTIGTIFTATLPNSTYLILEFQAGDKLLYASADGNMGIIKYALP